MIDSTPYKAYNVYRAYIVNFSLLESSNVGSWRANDNSWRAGNYKTNLIFLTGTVSFVLIIFLKMLHF